MSNDSISFTYLFFFRYYESIIESISEDGEQVTVKFIESGTTEVTAASYLKPYSKPVKKKAELDAKHR